MQLRSFALTALLAAFLQACTAPAPARVAVIPREATEAVFDGLFALQARPERAAEARMALDRATALAPTWIAPRRLLDESARTHLAGVGVLRAHREALARNPSDAARSYLAGRLEGPAGGPRFERAVRFDPDLSWGWHGLSFAAAAAGDKQAAVRHARAALERAADPYERTFFQTTLARQLAASGQAAEGLALLEAGARSPSISERERTLLLIPAVEIGLESQHNGTRERAYERGLAILRERDVPDADLEVLVARMKTALYTDDIGSRQLALALSAKPGRARNRLRAEFLPSLLAEAALERASELEGRPEPAGSKTRATRFASFAFRSAVTRWLETLPRVVLDSSGVPRDARLARVVELARALPEDARTASADSLVAFGDALLQAGWFKEARSVATRLSSIDLDAALALEDRAQAGLSILDGLARIAYRSDRGTNVSPPTEREASEASRSVRSLDGFLKALAPLFARSHIFLGGDTDVARVERTVLDSPRMSFAGVAELVHPGPTFSEEDERGELGIAGLPVPGIARLFAEIGRFALVGRVAGGGGADASVLPLLWCEERSGQHLGVPWRGTIAWCEAADLKSRAGRSGALISAAALHEGYWVDVDAVRDELLGWRTLRRRFSPENGATRDDVEAVLASLGLELSPRADERERRSTNALLGEANRVRLAVLADRADASGALGEMTLEDLLLVTTIHEEGHLCERTRFLPLLDHKLAVLRFLASCHFSPTRVGEELEYRAQLVALCDSPDPRIALAQVLDAAEGTTTSSLTPHSAGYKRLFDDFLAVLDAECVDESSRERLGLRGGLTLAHQMHVLRPDSVRRLAQALAKKKGLF